MTVGTEWAVGWARRSAAVLSQHRSELGDLDRAIGDGDHGENMDRGFTAVVEKLDEMPAGSSPSEVLRLIATTLISSIGGAAGPLFGTAYLRASESVAGEESLDASTIAGMLAAASDGVIQRGKAQPGEKTMVDAWAPAVEAALRAATAGEEPAAVLSAAADGAAAGAAATEPLIARKGRASYLGERAIGHRDPGAQSTALILRAAADAAADEVASA
jgi:dihydroxyacetone kinase, phosphoprotein-dependent, L subunit